MTSPSAQQPLLSLCMMVKDEAKSIRGVLEAAKPFIDCWTILDTGSEDNTPDIIREVMAGIPGGLHYGAFRGYAQTRNTVLDIDREKNCALFQLMLSGDEYLRDGEELRKFLKAQSDVDLFKIKLSIDDTVQSQPRIFRTGSKWRYDDAKCGVHEFPTHPDVAALVGEVADIWIEHIVSDSEKRFNNIWERHVPLLRAALEEDPNNERALIFLAQSYEALLPLPDFFHPGERITYAMEAMSLYQRRLQLPIATEDERKYLQFRYLDLARSWTTVYSPIEFATRAEFLKLEDPDRPDVAHLHVVAEMGALRKPFKYEDIGKIYNLAVEATHVANRAKASDAPVSTASLWKTHLIAAKAAKQMAVKFPEEFSERVREHVLAGVAAGGPEELFHGLVTGSAAGAAAEERAS